MTVATPVSLFYSYAHEDEEHRKDLEGHLKILERRGKLQSWHDRKIAPGAEWEREIDENLGTAELILLLLSMDFINSEYIWSKELEVAMQRHERGEARVVPIFVRAVSIERDEAPFMKLQGLPTDLRPVTSWDNVDEAWTDVVKGLRATVAYIQANRKAEAPRAPAASPRVGEGAAPAARAAQPMRQPRGGRPAAKAAITSAAQPATVDPLLERVVDAIVGQIEVANSNRAISRAAAASLDLRTVRQQVLRLIDTPEQKRVLWVDDHPEGNTHEAAALAKLQIEVIAVRSSDEAKLRIDDDPEPFDLLLSDWERPAEGPGAGLRLLRQLRAAGKTMPLVFYHGEFSADRRAGRTREALAAGAFGEAVLPGELLALVLRAFD